MVHRKSTCLQPAHPCAPHLSINVDGATHAFELLASMTIEQPALVCVQEGNFDNVQRKTWLEHAHLPGYRAWTTGVLTRKSASVQDFRFGGIAIAIRNDIPATLVTDGKRKGGNYSLFSCLPLP